MKPAFSMHLVRRPRSLLLVVLMLCWASSAWSDQASEYKLKAAFLYNFTTYTEWPSEVGRTLNLCIYGQDPFGEYIDQIQGKAVGKRVLAVRRILDPDQLVNCQIVFIARSNSDELLLLLNRLAGAPVLTVADTPGAVQQGVVLNLNKQKNRITFEANLIAAHGNGLNLSSKLLRLARDVIQ